MTDDYNDLDINNEEEGAASPPPPPGSNRTFAIAAAALGGLFLLALVLLVVFLLFIRPRLGGTISSASRVATQNAINTATVQAITQSALLAQRTNIAKGPTQTPAGAFLATTTPRPTNTATPVLAVATTGAPALSQDQARTATVGALLTQAAQAQQTGTVRAPTSTALPTTGFADEVGLPGLFGLGLILLAVIFVVRRLRSS